MNRFGKHFKDLFLPLIWIVWTVWYVLKGKDHGLKQFSVVVCSKCVIQFKWCALFKSQRASWQVFHQIKQRLLIISLWCFRKTYGIISIAGKSLKLEYGFSHLWLLRTHCWLYCWVGMEVAQLSIICTSATRVRRRSRSLKNDVRTNWTCLCG